MFKIKGDILLPLYFKNRRADFFPTYKTYMNAQWDSRDEQLNRLSYRLSQLLVYAKNSVSYYKEVLPSEQIIKSDPFKAIRQTPILSKDIVRNSIDSLYMEKGLRTYRNSTGGSTGEPVVFFQDQNYRITTLAATWLIYSWAGLMPGNKFVKLWGAERDLIDGKIGVKQQLVDWILAKKTLNCFNVSPEKQKAYLEEIRSFRPNLLEGYADALYEIAKFAKKSDIPAPKLSGIISSAGALYPNMRDEVESYFGTKVFDRYGSREAGNMAAQCEENEGLHICEETTFLEVVDDNGHPVNEGEEGRILVTNLHNYTMPLIRYEIGDRAIVGKQSCSCGRPYPTLARIVGRQSSSFIRHDGGRVSPVFFIHTIGVLCNDGSVKKFQAIQHDLDNITIKLIMNENLTIDAWEKRREVESLIHKAMDSNCNIRFVAVDHIEPTITGKHLYTVCEIK